MGTEMGMVKVKGGRRIRIRIGNEREQRKGGREGGGKGKREADGWGEIPLVVGFGGCKFESARWMAPRSWPSSDLGYGVLLAWDAHRYWEFRSIVLTVQWQDGSLRR